KWVAFASSRGSRGLAWFRKAANGAGEEEILIRPGKSATPGSWSPDGRFMLFNDASTPADIFAIDLGSRPQGGGEPKLQPLVSSPGNDVQPRFSPDGHWFSYASNESGRIEAYVRPFDPSSATPASGGRWQISKGGATFGGALWRGDGKELFYVSADGDMMSVAVSTKPTFQAEEPKLLFKAPPGTTFYDVSADGKRFLIPVPTGSAAGVAPPYKVILNWTSTLRK
ncbi:MAG: TolB family protein, partial [Bryobacteraceae bacterium]